MSDDNNKPIGKDGFASLLAQPLRRRTVVLNDIPFLVQEMTESEGAKYEIALQTNGKVDMNKARREMLALMLIDADGNKLVDSGDQLMQLPLSYASPIWEACLELNRYSEKEIKDLVKNSEGVVGSD